MAASIKELLEEYNAKVAQKLNALYTLIENHEGGGGGGGISADSGNDLELGSDNKAFFQRRTAEEIAEVYESLENVERFTTADLLTLQEISEGLINKADIDPETGRLVPSQLPYFSLTNTIVAEENTLQDFISNSLNYTYNEGDVITVEDGNGNTESYLYNGGDRGLEESYTPVNPGEVKFYDTATKLPRPGKSGFLYVILDTRKMQVWSNELGDYVDVAGGGDGSGGGGEERSKVRIVSVNPSNQKFIDWENDILLVKDARTFTLPGAGVLNNGSRYMVKTDASGTVQFEATDNSVSIEYNDMNAIGYMSQRCEAWVLFQDNVYYISGEVQ